MRTSKQTKMATGQAKSNDALGGSFKDAGEQIEDTMTAGINAVAEGIKKGDEKMNEVVGKGVAASKQSADQVKGMAVSGTNATAQALKDNDNAVNKKLGQTSTSKDENDTTKKEGFFEDMPQKVKESFERGFGHQNDAKDTATEAEATSVKEKPAASGA
jgi:hypothetical protein